VWISCGFVHHVVILGFQPGNLEATQKIESRSLQLKTEASHGQIPPRLHTQRQHRVFSSSSCQETMITTDSPSKVQPERERERDGVLFGSDDHPVPPLRHMAPTHRDGLPLPLSLPLPRSHGQHGHMADARRRFKEQCGHLHSPQQQQHTAPAPKLARNTASSSAHASLSSLQQARLQTIDSPRFYLQTTPLRAMLLALPPALMVMTNDFIQSMPT